MDIDLVYTWVDGNDPEWIARRDACIGKVTTQTGTLCKGRYADNDELKYSLRSIEKYAPWVRRIFIVTDRQVPRWLDTSNPKIRIVDHSEIIPEKYLPTFNANIIEHHLYNIPGLSEHFLYANDDMLLNRPVSPEMFFTPDGRPIMRFNRRPMRKLTLWYKQKIQRKKLSNYNLIIKKTATAVEKRFGKYYSGKPHHNIDGYRKSDLQHVREMFDAEIEPTLINHVRRDNDIQRCIYYYAALAEKRGKIEYVRQRYSFRLHIHLHNYYEKFRKYNPVFFCVNDSQYANDDDRRKSKEFLASLFPAKSQFEK